MNKSLNHGVKVWKFADNQWVCGVMLDAVLSCTKFELILGFVSFRCYVKSDLKVTVFVKYKNVGDV
jgi:hypothetical protein